ncbi:MAG: tetratricopeptide repeat protein, partial [Bacteroidetes bacterium]|nr:tetratricopeptide repeat protein [Bacteroidota bacterium]
MSIKENEISYQLIHWNMRTFNLLVFLTIWMFTPVMTFSQGEELSTQSKKAIKLYETGELLYKQENLQGARMNFQSAIEADPAFFEAYVLLGEILEQEKSDSAAVAAYKTAVSINPDKFPPLLATMADIEYRNGWYQGAVEHYTQYLGSGKAHGASRVRAEKNLPDCEFALEALKNPVPFNPINLGPNINSALNEYFPCITADNQTLLFTRLTKDPRSASGKQEDFFVSRFDSVWKPAVPLGQPINTTCNEGAPTLSADGNILIFTACESLDGYGGDRKGYGRCDLFVSKRSGNEWLEPYNLGIPVNSGSWESQPSFSADGRTLYFVSNRDNNYNIWFSSVDDSGIWSEPRKLGENINTEGYEGSVFIHPDNQTLYFSSNGHTGMGGLDIFVSRRDSLGDWGPPKNLGYPINSFKDDNSIVINADGKIAMFASDRKDGFGGLDLYSFELYEQVRPQVVSYMKGRVFDNLTGENLEARFELTNLKTGIVAVESFSNNSTGEFLVCLPANHDYALTVSRDGYLFYF